MNATTRATIEAFRAAMPPQVAHVQPQVTGDLLYVGYDYDGLRLDLYGNRATEDYGVSVHCVALSGSKVDIASVVKKSAFVSMEAFVDAQPYMVLA